MNDPQHPGGRGAPHPYVVILGTNEIASAVAVQLHAMRCGVVMSHDPFPPVIRRKMAFHDALFDDPVTLDGVVAERADSGTQIRRGLNRGDAVLVTELGLLDLIVVRNLDVLIDARMQKEEAAPDLRRLARQTIGLGPSFVAGETCDIAIETVPAKAGWIVERGAVLEHDGIPRKLGGRGAERFVYAPMPGHWHTPLDIGTRVFKDFVVGQLGDLVVQAPFDGFLRGVVRDGTDVPPGAKLLEIDSRGRGAMWSGIDPRGRMIAKGVAKAIALHGARDQTTANNRPFLLK